VRAYNRHLAVLVAPRTRLSLLVGLKVTITAMAPDRSWRWLQDLCNKVQRRAKPRTDKRARIRSSGEIYAAAMRELEEVSRKDLTLKTAIAYRDAFILALLTARPVRVRNATEIEIGRHLIGVDGRWLLVFAAEEVKNRQPLEFFLPDDLCPWLDHYLAEIRPVFPGAAQSPKLWLNQYGPVTSPRFIYQRLTKLTKRLLGVRINLHLLRDCAASSLAMVSSDFARAAAPLLGHRHFSTTERYYIQANDLEASRRVNAILEEIDDSLEAIE
jgi:site-specific recombinase XerD